MATITAGGLATGMDTNAIIDKLVSLESSQVGLLQREQTGVKAQISALGDLTSKLSALQTAAKALAETGALGVKVSSTNTAFSAAPAASALPGTFTVNVQQLATTARSRSQAFTADAVQGGTLTLSARGTRYDVAVTDGASLADVAYAIRRSGAPVSATVLDDGVGNKYLSLTARDSGYVPTSAPESALALSYAASGTQGTALSFTTTNARNAHLVVDGITFERSSNAITDVIPGVTLTLKTPSSGATPPGTPGGDPTGGTEESLTLAADADATQAKLKGFVDAYNGLMALVQKHLGVGEKTDRGANLAGDATLRSLQGKLHGLVSLSATGLSTGLRALADLGVKTGRDGALALDTATLGKALGKDPGAVNAIFSTSTTGVWAVLESLHTAYTRAGDGLFTVRQKGLESQSRRIDDQVTVQQRRAEIYRQTLVRQYAAMENVVSQMKSMGSFLAGAMR